MSDDPHTLTYATHILFLSLSPSPSPPLFFFLSPSPSLSTQEEHPLCPEFWSPCIRFTFISSLGAWIFHFQQSKEQVFPPLKRNKQLKSKLYPHSLPHPLDLANCQVGFLKHHKNSMVLGEPKAKIPLYIQLVKCEGRFPECYIKYVLCLPRAFFYSHCCQPARLNSLTLSTPQEVRMVSSFC